MSVKVVVIGLVLLLAGCGNLPRGAGLQREVLAHGSKASTTTDAGTDAGKADLAEPTEFAVEPITKDSLARYASWPEVGGHHLAWVKRVNQPNNRIIAPGDTVTVTIWNTEDNSLLTPPGQRSVNLPPVRVSSTGQVFLPYIGQKKISGMSPEHARSEIEKAYAAVTPSAQVQLELSEGRANTASLVSGVGKPGSYPLRDQDVTLLDVLAEAGGVASDLINPQIRLQRGDHTYGIGLKRLTEDTALNTTLQGGDRVFVEEDTRYFLSLGAAGSKAQHHFPQEKVTALDALSIIGGLAAERANAQGILVLRSYPDAAVRKDGSGPRHMRTIFTLDLTTADGLFSAGAFQICPSDLIYVTESPLIDTRNVFSVIGSVFGIAVQADKLGN